MRHLKISGRLDYEACRLLVEQVRSLAAKAKVTLNLARVTYLDMPALASLLVLDQELRQRGGQLILRSPSASVQRVLALCQVGTVGLISLTVRDPVGAS